MRAGDECGETHLSKSYTYFFSKGGRGRLEGGFRVNKLIKEFGCNLRRMEEKWNQLIRLEKFAVIKRVCGGCRPSWSNVCFNFITVSHICQSDCSPL